MSKKIFLAIGVVAFAVLIGFVFWKRPSRPPTVTTSAPESETAAPEQQTPPDEFSDKLDSAFVELEMMDGE